MTTLPEWRSVVGYEGLYEVSSSGSVRSTPRQGAHGGLVRQRVNARGYLSVSLSKERCGVKVETHRVVAAAFLGPCPTGQQVRHLNGDRLNPAVANLAYGTPSENLRDSLAHGTHPTASRTHCPNGHEYTAANIRRIPSRPNARYCRACEAARGKGPRQHPDFRPAWKV